MRCLQKYIIKAKDPWIARIDVAIEGFLTGPPPKGTQAIELTAHQVTDFIQVEEESIPSEEEQDETIREHSFINHEEDFEVFYQPNPIDQSKSSSRPRVTAQVSTN